MGSETETLNVQRDEIQEEIDRLMALLEHSEVDPSEDEADPDVVAPVPHLLFMHPPSHAYFLFPCPHADCDGEFDLTSAVAGLARSHESSCDGRQVCGGQRVRDKNGRGPCQLALKYTIAPGAAAEE